MNCPRCRSPLTVHLGMRLTVTVDFARNTADASRVDAGLVEVQCTATGCGFQEAESEGLSEASEEAASQARYLCDSLGTVADFAATFQAVAHNREAAQYFEDREPVRILESERTGHWIAELPGEEFVFAWDRAELRFPTLADAARELYARVAIEELL